MVVQTIKSHEMRTKWREAIDAAQAGQADTVIERYNQPVAVIIPFEDYEAILQELQDLRDARFAAKELEAWRQDPSTGRPYSEIREELVAEGLLDE